MKKLVTKIDYDIEADKLKIEQKFGSEFLGRKETEYDPKELEKTKGTKLNPTVGYRSLKKGENHKGFSTEHANVTWHDRKLFESIISQPNERLKAIKR